MKNKKRRWKKSKRIKTMEQAIRKLGEFQREAADAEGEAAQILNGWAEKMTRILETEVSEYNKKGG